MKKLCLTYLVLLLATMTYAQNSTGMIGFWKLTSFNGKFILDGVHLDQQVDRNTFSEHVRRSYMSGGLFFNSSSYFWHPNFLAIDLDAGFSPETGQQLSLVAPDRSEVNTLKKLNASLTLFQNNNMNFRVYTNLHEGYNNRENLTNIETTTLNWGSLFTYRNKLLPFTISYNKKKNKQTELANDRSYDIRSSNILGTANKSFGFNDTHLFTVSKNNYVYEDSFLLSEEVPTSGFIENEVISWRLKDSFILDSKSNYRFNSSISSEDQKGTYYNYKRFQILENLSFKLPKNFRLLGNYSYFDIETDVENSKQQFVRGELIHQLYKSLRTRVSLEYNEINSSQFLEKSQRAGISIRYVKKIPLKGLLSISYSLKSNQQNRDRATAILHIQNEEYTLTDSQMVLLNEQNVNVESVVVKDETGTIIYQLYFDYLLIERNELLEIQRVPGGKIPDNAVIYIDYTATQPSSYQYNTIHNNFFASVSLFDKKIELYYKNSQQEYIDPQNIDFLTLDYFNQNVYGGRLNFGFVNLGIEQDNLNSTIIPYRLTRYYLVFQGNIKNKLLFTVNGTVRNYQMIIQEGKKQQYYNLTGTATYSINQRTKLNIHGSYLEQSGDGIDLNLFTSRMEFSTRFLQIYIKASIELYKNKFYAEELDYKRFAIQILRKF